MDSEGEGWEGCGDEGIGDAGVNECDCSEQTPMLPSVILSDSLEMSFE